MKSIGSCSPIICLKHRYSFQLELTVHDLDESFHRQSKPSMFHLVYRVLDFERNGNGCTQVLLGIDQYFYMHSQAPQNARIEKTQSSAHVSNLTSDKFWLLIAIIKNRLLPRYCSPATVFPGFPGINCLLYYEGKYEIIYDYPVVQGIHFLFFCSWFFHLHIRFW